MTDKTGQGQADKIAVEEHTAQVGAENRETREQQVKSDEPRSRAAKVLQVDPVEARLPL